MGGMSTKSIFTSQCQKNKFCNLQKRRLKTILNFLSSLFSKLSLGFKLLWNMSKSTNQIHKPTEIK